MDPAKSIPQGVSVVTPRLFCHDPAAEIEFCKSAFGAEERVRRPGADGKIAHGLVTVGSSMIMIEAEYPMLPNRAPQPDGSSSVAIYLYVEDVDATVERAAAAGARIILPPTTQFWGDRTAWVVDPAGHVWTVATRVEETTEEQRRERLSAMQRPQK